MSSCQLFEVTTDGQPTEFKVNDGQDNTLNTSSIIDHASYSFKALNGKYFTKDEMRADHNKRTILNKIIIKIFLEWTI